MKKMMILMGLLALAVLVVSCTQGGTLAGEATKTKCPITKCPPAGLRCDNILTLLEGETITTTAQDNNGIRGEHDLLITLINSTSTRLIVDSIPETIHNRQSALVNNVMITAWYVLYQDYAGGIHSVTLCVGE